MPVLVDTFPVAEAANPFHFVAVPRSLKEMVWIRESCSTRWSGN
jgi:hypothetical protein